MPWNPNLLALDLESKTSTSTLNKPRTGTLDEIKAPMSTSSSSNPSARSSTQPQNSPSASRFSSSGPSVQASMKSTATAAPNMSRFSEMPLIEKNIARSQFKHQSQLRQQSYSQPLSSLNTQSTSTFKFPPSIEPLASGQRLSQDKDKYRHSQFPSKHNSRLTFQQPPPLPPNPPLLAHTTLGPPKPLTLSSLQSKRISPYLPTYYYYPPSPSTRQPARLSTLPSVLTAGGTASRASLQPPPQSLYPNRSAVGMSRKSFNANLN